MVYDPLNNNNNNNNPVFLPMLRFVSGNKIAIVTSRSFSVVQLLTLFK